ncbi:alpha/beta hydrolase-fold protein [Nibricoccus sp. IMCC34717]|uniref:alpha/beta hydrolase-fold protein n=1 Tax=Nibricoccus sp. IMCC34717 TaxID=3034021 RepID=UPI00384D2C52
MNPLRLFVFFAAAVLGTAFAQEPNYLSPEVSPDGHITFRIFAPNAHSVTVQGLRRDTPLAAVRDERGLWTAKSEALPPDCYSYVFNVDGVITLDRKNRSFQRWIDSVNQVDVTAGTHPLWAEREVPHGAIVSHHYSSRFSPEKPAELFVYLPPGYNKSSPPLPVLVLCHGDGDDASAWVDNGRVRAIADNLLSEGKIKPLIIAMPYGHAVPYAAETTDPDYYSKNIRQMRSRIVDEVLPLLRNTYNASSAPQDLALAGLSMGGEQALEIGLSSPDVFPWVGAFSPGYEYVRDETLDQLASSKVRLNSLWIFIGDKDYMIEGNKALSAKLTQRSIPHAFKVTKGSHEWSVWREALAEYLPLLFRQP